MGFRYSVVCDTLKWIGYDVLENPRQILAAIREAGYDGADLGGDLERLKPTVIKPLTDGLGLRIPEVLGAWAYFHAGENRDLAGTDEAARRRGIEYAKKTIDLAAQLGAEYFEVCAAQPPIPQVPFPELPIATLRRNFVAACREICQYAQPRGITVLFEPLNPYEAYPGVMTSVYHALSVIEELGYENLGVQPDIFHMNMSEASPVDAVRAGGKRVRIIHMNETNHYRLGTGHGDHKGVLRVLKEIGFDGYISIYMPLISQEVMQLTAAGYGRGGQSEPGAPKTTRPELLPVLSDQLNYLKALEAAVDAQLALEANV